MHGNEGLKNICGGSCHVTQNRSKTGQVGFSEADVITDGVLIYIVEVLPIFRFIRDGQCAFLSTATLLMLF